MPDARKDILEPPPIRHVVENLGGRNEGHGEARRGFTCRALPRDVVDPSVPPDGGEEIIPEGFLEDGKPALAPRGIEVNGVMGGIDVISGMGGIKVIGAIAVIGVIVEPECAQPTGAFGRLLPGHGAGALGTPEVTAGKEPAQVAVPLPVPGKKNHG